VLVAAGVSLWQFKLYGSPLVADSTGTPRVDPLTVLAPALTLLALATLGLLAFGPGARLLQALTVRRDSILPVLAGWQVARRVRIFGAAVLLLTVSVGGTTAAAVYSQTWSTAQLNAAQQANGSAIRVMLSPGTAAGGDPVTAEPYLHLSGANAAATVLATPARVADETVSFTALAADNVTAVMNQVGGAVGTQLIASAISGERAGSPLGEELTVAVTANAPADQRGGRIEVSAWVDDEDGSLALLRLGTVELIDAMSAGGAVSGHLPDGVGEWQLIALQATLAGADGARGIDVTLNAEGTDYPLALSSAQATKRATSYDETGPLPVVVTRALAERFALDNGTVFDLRLPNTASVAEAVVTGLVDAIPGATGTRAVVADLPSLNRHLLTRSDRMPQSNEVWIVPEPRADLVRPAVEVSRTSATVTTVQGLAANPVVAPAITVLWWGVAGALLLAIIAVAAITRTFLADRRQEVIVLRALGLSPAEQARVRLLELAGVLGGALVLGLISGGVASVLTVTELATTSTGLATPVHLRFDALGWVTLIFATIAAVVTISFGYAGRVGSQARDREYREETR
jgi:hypothetical protein